MLSIIMSLLPVSKNGPWPRYNGVLLQPVWSTGSVMRFILVIRCVELPERRRTYESAPEALLSPGAVRKRANGSFEVADGCDCPYRPAKPHVRRSQSG